MSFSFNPHGFQLMYSLISVFMWAVALLFSIEYMEHYKAKKRYYIFMVATFFATFGVLLSGDLMTTFVAFEVMSFTSYVLVIHEENAKCMRAGETYLAVAVIGGMCMLIGLMLLYDLLGTLRISELGAAALPYAGSARLYTASALILVGFGAKAGMFPLHIWLPKAHPVAPAPASALLSGILTKSGIFGALVISCSFFIGDIAWGKWILDIGVITMFLGALLGLFSVDLKRTLACSSVSQIGFITVGIGLMCMLGEENILAARGTVLHMVNHSMLKLLLFSCAGAIYMKTHTLDLNKLRGYGRGKWGLAVLFGLGGICIAGVPMTSGYVSKTLLHEGIVELIEHFEHMGYSYTGNYELIEWIFLISGGLTLAYMLKLFVCIFIEKNSDGALQQKYDAITPAMNRLSGLVIAAPAAVLLAMGLFPHALMDGLSNFCMDFLCVPTELWAGEHAHVVDYLSLENLKGSCISIAIGLFLYFVVVRRLMTKCTVVNAKSRTGKVNAMSRYANDVMNSCSASDSAESRSVSTGKNSRSVKSNGTANAKACNTITREYLDLWPKFIDLEDRIYRPLIKLLINAILYVFAYPVSMSAEWLIMLLGASILKPIDPERAEKLCRRYKESRAASSLSQFKENSAVFLSTLSFGLITALIGVCIILLTMLLK